MDATNRIEQVKKFWNENPLWAGESQFPLGSKAFFEEHRETYINDCFAGELDPRFFQNQGKILDLGCGIGFWLIEFAERNYAPIYGADLSQKSLELAEKRLGIYGKEAELSIANAEELNFPDHYFDHINCQGVVHHTVNPKKAVQEIYRVLKPGGTAVISVYYKNFVLRNMKWFSPLLALFKLSQRTLKGRGREKMFDNLSAEEIIRKYDGEDNPIGLGYTKREFMNLLGHEFQIDDIYFHFFPKRALSPNLPKSIHKFLDRRMPFMIYANVKKVP